MLALRLDCRVLCSSSVLLLFLLKVSYVYGVFFGMMGDEGLCWGWVYGMGEFVGIMGDI